MQALARLQRWYAAQCNGDWEHTYGVQIETLDNPGWHLEVDLVGTELEGKSFEPIRYGVSEQSTTSGDDWIHCHVIDGKFHGHGGSLKLEEIINVFLQWAEAAA